MPTPQSRHRANVRAYNQVSSGAGKVFTYLMGLGIIFVIIEVVFSLGVSILVLAVEAALSMVLPLLLLAIIGFLFGLLDWAVERWL